MARLLAIADEEDEVLSARIRSGGVEAPDVVVSCGDLRPGYVDLIATTANAPLVYVRGNHDTEQMGYADPHAAGRGFVSAHGVTGVGATGAAVAGVGRLTEMGGTPLDLRILRVGGLKIAGLDGSLNYRAGIVGFSEAEMSRRAVLLAMRAALAGGVDVLVTHAPPRGYGDLDDLPHRGFACFNWLLRLLRPQLMLCGHVHLNYGRIEREHLHPSGTRIVNAFRYWEGDVPQAR